MKNNTTQFKAFTDAKVEITRGAHKGLTGTVINGRCPFDCAELLARPITVTVKLETGDLVLIPEKSLAAARFVVAPAQDTQPVIVCRICLNTAEEFTLGWHDGIQYAQQKFLNFTDTLAAARKANFTHVFLNHELEATAIANVKL